MKFWIYEKLRSDEELELEPKVYTHVDGEAVIDLYRKEGLLPVATMGINKVSAAILLAALAGMSGCTGMGRLCDEARLDLQYTHISHPLAGAPFGPKAEEDAVHTLGPMGRCVRGRGYVDLGLGWKPVGAGFYGPDLTGTLNVGVTLWSSSH